MLWRPLIGNKSKEKEDMLCKSALKINLVIDVVTKTVNFITARALNYKQFATLLEGHEAEHSDISCHIPVRWQSQSRQSIKKS